MQVEVCNRQSALECPAEAVREVIRLALEKEGRDAELSVALVGDAEMAVLNERFLGSDAVTDVLAFPYESEGKFINGEIVANAELAVRESASRPHGAADELMLYVVHGLLHLLGYDDDSPEATQRMRRREQDILRAAGRVVAF